MNITSSTGASVIQSILKSANEQPKLALQLLQQSLAGLTPPQTGKSLPTPPVAAPTASATSPRIDIRV